MTPKKSEAVRENLKLREAIRKSALPACTKPWTSLEERSHDGVFKTCCWLKFPLGKIGAGSARKLLDLWNGRKLRRIRELLLQGAVEKVCSERCPVLAQREKYFEKQEFYEYSKEELESFDENFLMNRMKVMRAILNKETTVNAMPLRLKLHPSNVCNLRCVMCDLDREAKVIKKDWYFNGDLDRFKLYLEELKVFGGEPFACPVSKKVIFDSPRNHINYAFVTNGTLLDRDILDRLSSIRIGWIDVSLDSCHRGTYESIRAGANFGRVNANLRHLIGLRKSHAVRRFPIYADFVIQKNNYREIGDFVSYCSGLGLRPNFTLVIGSYELSGDLPEVKKRIESGMKRAGVLSQPEVQKDLKLLGESLADYRKRLKREKHLRCLKRSRVWKHLKSFHSGVRSLLRKINRFHP